MAFARNGELFGVLKFSEALPLDDTAGRILVRNVHTAWLRLSGTSMESVYEAFIEEVTSWRVVLRLSKQMCSDQQLTDQGKVFVDLQFQLNRKFLCEWHFAIDRLGATHLSLLFPEQGASEANEVSIRVLLCNYVYLSLSCHFVSLVQSRIISVIFLAIPTIVVRIDIVNFYVSA